MLISRKLSIIFSTILAFAGIVCATPASAQATRTWVSGVGDDSNPCSRTAPCKTFAGAMSKTAANGEINCLDPGGFGAVTVTKSLSIVCDYTEGGILSAGAGVNGIIVNAPATSIIFLSGLDMNGAGNAQNGLRIIAGAAVHLQNSTIRNYQASSGLGISFQPSGSTELFIRNSTIADNGNASTGGGILVQPTGAAGSGRVTIENSTIANNFNNGILVNTTGNTGPSSQVNIIRSTINGNGAGVAVLSPVGTTGITVMVTDSQVFNNTTGFSANGGTTQVAVGNTVIAGNTNELTSTNGGLIQSFGDNRRIGNVVPGTFSPPTLPFG